MAIGSTLGSLTDLAGLRLCASRFCPVMARGIDRLSLAVGVLLTLERAGGSIDLLACLLAGRLLSGLAGHGHAHGPRVIAAHTIEGGLTGGIILAPLESRLSIAMAHGVRLVSRIAVAAGAGVGGVAALRAGGLSYFCLIFMLRKTSSNGMPIRHVLKDIGGPPPHAFAVDFNVLHMIAGVGCDGEALVFALLYRYGAGRSNAAAFAGRGSDVIAMHAIDRDRTAFSSKWNLFGCHIGHHDTRIIDFHRVNIVNSRIGRDLKGQHCHSAISGHKSIFLVFPHQLNGILAGSRSKCNLISEKSRILTADKFKGFVVRDFHCSHPESRIAIYGNRDFNF